MLEGVARVSEDRAGTQQEFSHVRQKYGEKRPRTLNQGAGKHVEGAARSKWKYAAEVETEL